MNSFYNTSISILILSLIYTHVSQAVSFLWASGFCSPTLSDINDCKFQLSSSNNQQTSGKHMNIFQLWSPAVLSLWITTTSRMKPLEIPVSKLITQSILQLSLSFPLADENRYSRHETFVSDNISLYSSILLCTYSTHVPAVPPRYLSL